MRSSSEWARLLSLDTLATRVQHLTFSSRRRHTHVARAFVEFLSATAPPEVTAATVHDWVLLRLQKHCISTTCADLGALRRVLDVLQPNPVEQWYYQQGDTKENILARLGGHLAAPAAKGWHTLGDEFTAFLSHRQRLNRKHTNQVLVLRRFDGFLAQHRVRRLDDVDAELLRTYMRELSTLSASSRLNHHRTLRQFFRWLRRGERISAPLDDLLKLTLRQQRLQAHIFTLKQLADIFTRLRTREPWQGLTAFTALHLIYAAGLRITEATRLRVDAVALRDATLLIRDTKFGKSRRIPLGRRVTSYLTAYAAAREARFGKSASDGSFFVGIRGQALEVGWLRLEFRQACCDAGVLNQAGRTPRVHDLRHSFAVHRLHKWYAEGHDVQNKLVLLSVYMGHVYVTYTAWYLQLTSDVLRLAGGGLRDGLDALPGSDATSS